LWWELDFVGHRKAVTVVVSVGTNHSYFTEKHIEVFIVNAFVFDVIEWFMNSSPSLCRSSILRSLRKNRRMAAHPNPAARTAAVLWVVRTAHSLYGYETSHYHPLFLPFISHTFMNNIRECLICEK